MAESCISGHAAHALWRPRLQATVTWLLAGVSIGFAGFVAVARFDLHVNLATVLTASMKPTYSPGDAVVTRPTPVSAVKPGMIILANPPGQTTAFAHRVVSVTRRAGSVLVQTKGDANPQVDDWRDVLATPTVPRVVAVVPKLGYVLSGLQGGHGTQGRVTPFAIAGLLITLVASALTLATGHRRPIHGTS